MSVKIRLSRLGSKKRPFYRVVATDSRSPRDGKFIEVLGTYNPLTETPAIKLDLDKINQWIGKGAVVSETVKKLIRKQAQPCG
ncbi:MAG: 30S ribosomal protein S16 [bacterium]